MKGVKQVHVIKHNANRQNNSSDSQQQPESSSSSLEQQPIQSEAQQSVSPSIQESQSQYRSSELVSNDLVYDSEVGYETGNYKMQSIKARRWNLKHRRFEYLIKWKGYSDKYCTWQTTEDIIRQPGLQLKYLGTNSLLANFQRTHAKTTIYNQDQQKNSGKVKDYHQTYKNHLKYASKQLIEDMDRQLEQLYGKKVQNCEQNSQKREESICSSVKLQSEKNIEQEKQPSLSQILPSNKKWHVLKQITIQNLIYYPCEFQLRISIHYNSSPENRMLITCEDLMKISPQTGIICLKHKLALIQKWKRENLPLS